MNLETHARPPRPPWRRWLSPALAALAPALALYLLTAAWPDTPDGLFHLHRVRALAEALRMGVLTPRWFPDFAFSYGYPVLNFYAPLFYYPPALLHLAGLDLIAAVRVTLAAWYALSGLAAYALLRGWARPLPAALGALLYLAYPYRLYDLFVRGALPEFAAFLWPPLIAWAAVRWVASGTRTSDADRPDLHDAGTTASIPEQQKNIIKAVFHAGRGATAHEKAQSGQSGQSASAIFKADAHAHRGDTAYSKTKSGQSGKSASPIPRPALLILAALAWAGLILTHNLTAMMTALAGLIALALWLVVMLLRRRKKHHDQRSSASSASHSSDQSILGPVLALTLPLALGAGLSATYALPALAEASWVGLSAGGDVRGYAAHFAGLSGLFDWALIYRYPDAAQPTVPAPGYAAILLIAAVLALLLPQARGRRAGLGISAGVALAALWLTTGASAFVWDALAPALGKLQFPWRWHTVAALALACVGAWLLEIGRRWLVIRSRLALTRPLAWGGALVLAAFLALNALGGLAPTPVPFTATDLTAEQMWDFDAAHGQVGASWTGEFLPRWVTEQRWAIGGAPSQAPAEAKPAAAAIRSVRVLAQSYEGERLHYNATEPGQLVYHAFYYPAWRVEVDGRALPTRAVGDLGLLAADLPAGEHEVIRRWGATPAVWAGRALSALAWLVVLGLLALGRDRWRSLRVGLWMAAAALAVIGGSGWLAREQAVTPVGADYGIVRLEAAAIQRIAAHGQGATAAVTLHWLVTAAPEPLTAFVHVLAPDGRVVAGHDAPLGGVYTPASRWQPGQMLPDRHVIPLPADLPAGVYQLKAGVYRPGAADAPLVPAGQDPTDPRVSVGTLEVRP